MTVTRWLFADQLGDHFLDDPEQPILLVESQAALARRPYHRAKRHLVMSALRHRAAELGDRVTFVQAHTYAEALARVPGSVEVVHPTSRAALRFVQRHGIDVLPPRGFVATFQEFAGWAGSGRLRQEEFYRAARRRTGLLMDGDQPEAGRWNFDAENREPPPKGRGTLGAPDPWEPTEDAIDEQVRADLDAWKLPGVGEDGPRRFAVTADEAEAAAEHFLTQRLPLFGPYEDAMLAADPWLAHSMLSVPLNLGLLDPLDLATRAAATEAPLPSREGFVRQLIGWRDYIWHLYWHFGEGYADRNALAAHTPIPDWFTSLAAEDITARCLSTVLGRVREFGWSHHIERLMVLGSWALQQGYPPRAVSDWFQACFVDGYEWVMLPNVIGMSQFADGGMLATKPYTSGGAYLNRMSDFCGDCAYRPTKRTGKQACPFTAGYWAFLARNEAALRVNHRMRQPLASMRRLSDLPDVLEQAAQQGHGPP